MKRLLFLLPLLTATSLCAQDNGIDQSLQLVTLPEGGKVILWHGKPGRSYFVQVSDENEPLAKWTWAPLIEGGNDQQISHEVGGTADKGFFRLRYTDQVPGAGESLDSADFDGDGLNNLAEIAPPAPLSATDPLNPDTDGDELTDGWERTHGLDPNDASGNNGASGDPDGDGLPNTEEQSTGADPHNTDTDGDGLSDTEEASFGTNPNSQDSDGDGVLDPVDGYALTAGLSPPRVAEARYAVIDLHQMGLPVESVPLFLDRHGDVFYTEAMPAPVNGINRFLIKHFEITTGSNQTVCDITGTGQFSSGFSDGGWVAWASPADNSSSGIFRWKKGCPIQSMDPLIEGGAEYNQIWLAGPYLYPNICPNDDGVVAGMGQCAGNARSAEWCLSVFTEFGFLWPQGTSTGNKMGEIEQNFNVWSAALPPEGSSTPRPTGWPESGIYGGYFQPSGMSTNPLRVFGGTLIPITAPKTSMYEAGIFNELTNADGIIALSSDGEVASAYGSFALAAEGWQTRILQVWDPVERRVRSDLMAPLDSSRRALAWTGYPWSPKKLVRNGRLLTMNELVPEGEVVGNPVCLNSHGAILTDTGKLLLPVEVEQQDYTQAKGIRFCRWLDSFTGNALNSDCADNDRDRFRIKIPAVLPNLTKIHIKSSGLLTAVIGGQLVSKSTDGDYDVTMTEENGAVVSKWMLLVSDGEDDFEYNGIGTENGPDDQTLLADFDSPIEVTLPKLNNAKVVFSAQKPLGDMEIQPYYLSPAGDVPSNMEPHITNHLHKLKEIYRQIGVRVGHYAIEGKTVPQSWFDVKPSPDSSGNYYYLSASESNAARNTVLGYSVPGKQIRIGYVNAKLMVYGDNNWDPPGHALGFTVLGKDGIIVSMAQAPDGARTVLGVTAHEVGHALNLPHTLSTWQRWLMKGDGIIWRNNPLEYSKRFQSGDFDIICNSQSYYVPSLSN